MAFFEIISPGAADFREVRLGRRVCGALEERSKALVKSEYWVLMSRSWEYESVRASVSFLFT
jgi:hypothetical protein